MERDRGTTVLGLGALSLLVAAATFGLARVFVVGTALPTLLLGAFGSLAIAAALRRLPGVLAAVLGEVAVAWLVAAILAPGTLRYGFPTLRSGRALVRALSDAIASGRTTIAPVPATRPFLAAALLALGATVVIAHAALVRGRRPLIAVAGLATLPAFADLALGLRPPLALPLALVAGAIAVVVADGIRRVRSFASISPPVGLLRAFAVATRGSRATLVGVTVVALVAPPLLPGSDAEPLLDLSGAAGPVTRVDPFVSIRAQLTMPERVPLLRVVTDDSATYERLFALDRFDGVTWYADPPTFADSLGSPATLPYATRLDPAPVIRQEIQVVGGIAGGGWLPAPYPARTVRFAAGRLSVDARTGAMQLTAPLVAGDRYEVEALRAVPGPGDLRDRDPRAATSDATLLDLPADLRPALTRIAEAWSAGATTPYDRILAIQERFLDGSFRYSLDAPLPEGRRDVIRFLTRSRTGFCQQFATAMAALVRALGYPARVAVGFREGTRTDGAYVITNQDAHSWVEVPFPGYGWLPFEPTPGRPNPIGSIGSYLDPNEGGSGSGTGTSTGTPTSSPAPRTCVLPDGTTLPAQYCRAQADRIDPEGAVGGRPIPEEPSAAPAPALPIVPVSAGVLALVLLALPFARDAARRRRIARARTPRERVLAAVGAFESVGRDLGAGRERAETLREFAARVTASHPRLDADLRRLIAVGDRAAYGAADPTPEEASVAVSAGRDATATLRDDVGWVRRVTGAYRVRV